MPESWARRWAVEPRAPTLLVAGERLTISGQQLEATSAAAASQLASRGVGAGDRVVWPAQATAASIVAAIAVLRMGAVLVPVNPRWSERELAHVVTDVEPRLNLCTDPVPSRGPSGRVTQVDLSPPSELDPALIVYTSGTTGAPKGAVLTHGNLAAGTAAVREAWRWSSDDRLTLALPLFHVHGLCIGLFGTLDAGASAVVLAGFDAASVLATGVEHDATLFFGVPTMYHRLASQGGVGALARLRLCVSGSAPLSVELWQELRRLAGVEVLERYGMTETLLTLSNPYDGERRPGSVGLPLPGVSCRVVGKDVDGVGELEVRGPSVFAGYWRRPRDSAACFDGAWFKTGDLVDVDPDGYMTIRGRSRELIITGGFNVYPAEVEQVLGSHPSVAEAAVAGLPSEEYGETVAAWVVRAGPVDEAQLLDHAAQRLARYKVPRCTYFVEALPHNAMGKLQRQELVDWTGKRQGKQTGKR